MAIMNCCSLRNFTKHKEEELSLIWVIVKVMLEIRFLSLKDVHRIPYFFNTSISRTDMKELVHWRLGRVEYHQQCTKCNNHQQLSRTHAISCSSSCLLDSRNLSPPWGKTKSIQYWRASNIVLIVLKKSCNMLRIA